MAQVNGVYHSMPVLCRKCLEIPVSEQELAEILDRYLETLDDAVRVPPEVYEARLAVCADCASRVGYTCLKCGCYVQARAAKRSTACSAGFWHRMEETNP